MKVRMSVEQSNTEAFIKCVMDKYHFLKSDRETLTNLYAQLKNYLGPYASYRINQKVTGVPAIDEGPSAIVAMTLGAGVDRLQERYMRSEKLEEAYMIDCLCAELLLRMYAEFNASYAKFHRRYVKRYVFIGDEIPVTAMSDLLKDIRGEKKKADNKTCETTDEAAAELCDKKDKCEKLMEHENITCNEYGVLSPSKSVVFYAVLSENPNQMCEGVCSNCHNVECENRVITGIQTVNVTPVGAVDENESGEQNLTYGYQRIFGVQ